MPNPSSSPPSGGAIRPVVIGVVLLIMLVGLGTWMLERSSNDDDQKVTTVAGPPASARPTRANTGPTSSPSATMTAAQFLRSGTCRNARITDTVRVEIYSDVGAWDRDFSFDNCVLEGGFYWAAGADSYPRDRYPTISIEDTDILGSMVFLAPAELTMDRSYVSSGGFWAPCADCAGTTFGLVREMPVTVTDTLFVHPQGSPPSHTEALHVAGTGQGYRFINTRFVQKGPFNGSQTGALFFHGGDSTFESVWFDYDGSAAAYYTVYIFGRGPGAEDNVVRNSAIQNGKSFYIYPVSNDGLTPATYEGNRDLASGQPIL
jgi:hypothetical protein